MQLILLGSNVAAPISPIILIIITWFIYFILYLIILSIIYKIYCFDRELCVFDCREFYYTFIWNIKLKKRTFDCNNIFKMLSSVIHEFFINIIIFTFSHLVNLFQLKGYKVTDVTRTRKIGIACRNFQDLKQKACLKLNVSIY